MPPRPLVLIAALALLVAGPAQAAKRYRWPVKTGADAAARLAHPSATAGVSALNALPRPAHLTSTSPRRAPVEQTLYTVTGRLLFCRLEADGDYHLVIEDATGQQTMIAEIPDPAKVGAASPWKASIAAARQTFASRYHPTASRRDCGGVRVTVRGAGFFDKLHDAEGAADNGLELHPVLDFALAH